MDTLRRFNGDKGTKEDLLNYIVAHLEDSIIARAYNNEDVKSLADAVKEIKGAFEQLDIDFAPKIKDVKSTTEAR
jgi:hypothetical protein